MNVDFNGIREHIIPLEEFRLKWRFMDEKLEQIPHQHLEQLKPLDVKASNFLWKYISDIKLHQDTPFKNGFFRTIDKAKIAETNNNEIKKWLYHRGLPFDHDVFLSWQPKDAMIVPWKILIKYFDRFYYSDDLTVIDQSLTWALLFYHEDEIYFGTNKDFKASKDFSDMDFIW